MITGVHAIICSRDADAYRAFLRDIIGWSSVDAGGGLPGGGELGIYQPLHPLAHGPTG